MTHTLCRLGSTDPADGTEVAAALEMLERLLALCELHLKDENEFVHPALERARPGSAARIAAEHVHHAEAIADLRDLAGLVGHGREGARAAALARLYRALALFVADNLQHMHVEETTHNPVLWAEYSDAELVAIEQALVASIPRRRCSRPCTVPAGAQCQRARGHAGRDEPGHAPEPFRAVLASPSARWRRRTTHA